jgi:hypothetical protein
MSFARLYYETKLMGKRVVLVPLLIMVGATLIALFIHNAHNDPARFLLAIPEMLLPLAAGVIIGTVIAIDPALELQLTVPRKYHLTGLLRISLIFLCIACSAFVFMNGTNVLHLLYLPTFTVNWSPIACFLLVQMIWFPPLFACAFIGFCFALVMQSRTAGGALLGCIWVAEIMFKNLIWLVPWLRPFFLFPSTLVAYPLTNIPYALYLSQGLATRLELLGIALVLLLCGWLLLRNTERMLKGATEE